MATDLGSRAAAVAKDSSSINPYGNGFWVGKIDGKIWGSVPPVFEVYHISLKGPTGSSLEVWIDQEFYSTTPRGDINEWDPKQAMIMRSGQVLYFFWNSSAAPVSGTTPLVLVRIRERTII
jgi:hypothetical protein